MKRSSPLSLLAGLFSFGLSANAQVSSSPSTQETAPPQEVVVLSPFEVSSEQDMGYIATNTLSGSRLNTPLSLTPAAISEFTPEFLQDIGANNVLDAVEYSIGFTEDNTSTNGNPQQGSDINLNSRGVPRATGDARPVARDYFIWFLNGDSYNTERLSFSRGPNSILFGLGDPGGIINTTTKRARFRTFSELEFKTDDNGSWRVHLDHNQKVTDDIGVRVNLLKEDRRTWRELEYYDQERLHLAGTWRVFDRTSLRVDYERGVIDRLAGRNWSGRDRFTPYIEAGSPAYNRTTNGNNYPTGVTNNNNTPFLVFDSSSGQFMNWQRFGRSTPAGGGPLKIQDPSIIPWEAVISGAAATSDNDFWTYSVFLEQELFDNLFIELAYNEQSENRAVRTPVNHGDIALNIDPNTVLPSGQPNQNFGKYYIESTAQYTPQGKEIENLRATLSYEFDTESPWFGRHRLVGVAANEDVLQQFERWRETNLTPLGSQRLLGNTQNIIRRRTYLDFNGGNRAFDQDPWAGQAPVTINSNGVSGTVTPGFFKDRDRPSRSEASSLLIAGQSYFLPDERLALTYGFRRDDLDQYGFVETDDPVTGEVLTGELGPVETFSGDTRTYGGVFRVTRWLSAFANFSENFSPQTALDINDANVGNVSAEGEDYGLKVSVLENRLNLNLGYFKTSSVNRSSNPFNYKAPIDQIWEAIDGVAGGPRETPDGFRDSQDFTVEGYEFEAVANLARGLSLMANFSLIEGEVENVNQRTRAYVEQNRSLWTQNAALIVPATGQTVGATIDRIDNLITNDRRQEGKDAEGNREHTFNIFAKYQFQDGWLKPWSLALGARYRGKSVAGFGANDEVFYGNNYWLADLRLGYRRDFRAFERKVQMNLRLNVSNLLDEDELIITETDGTGVATDYVFQRPRTLTFSANFKF